MAYLDLDTLFSAPDAGRGAGRTAPTGFSALEWSVIALAQQDDVGSLSEPSRLSRALGGVFGRGVKSRLADPRLEALRRLAVHAWRRGFALPMHEINRFIAAGFQEAQIETLVTSVTGIRVGTNRGRFA